ncbi:MAG TPA: hypothetical protein VGI16_02230 [Candidatus Acidoferrum sp.]|jgi:nucleoside phosphorylase
MMRILVTFAVDAEFAPWRALRDFRRAEHGDVEIYSAEIESAEVSVLLTGVGLKKDWLAAAKSIWRGDLDVCISSGLAGALRACCNAGDILTAREISGGNLKETTSCEAQLTDLAATCGAKLVQSFYTTDHVVSRAEEKRELSALADAVDMESANILHQAAALGAKVAAIRAISDIATEDLPLDFNRAITQSGAVSVPRILAQLARNPAALPALMRFGSRSTASARKLAEFLDQYLVRLAQSGIVAATKGVSAA